MNFESFKDLIDRFGAVSGLVIAGPVLAFLAAAGGMAPFWVPSVGFIGALVMVVAIILVFSGMRKRKTRLNRGFLFGFAGAMAISLAAYLVLFLTFVIPGEKPDTPFIAGCEWTHAAKLSAADLQVSQVASCPLNRGDYFPLDEEGIPLDRIWTADSTASVKHAMLGAWLMFLFFTSALLTTFANSFTPNPKPKLAP